MTTEEANDRPEAYDIKRNHKTINIFALEEAKGMAPVYKLTYFPIMGIAEPIRYLLSYGNIEFIDERIENDNWPAMKSSTPFGQLPVLTAKGQKYTQSIAISRFIAKQVGLAGENEWEDLEIDSMVDIINDIRLKLSLYHYENDANIKESHKEALFKEMIPFYAKKLEDITTKNGGYLACKRLTWADIYFIAILDYMNAMAGFDLIKDYPNLHLVKKCVVDLPSIQTWLQKRPITDF